MDKLVLQSATATVKKENHFQKCRFLFENSKRRINVAFSLSLQIWQKISIYVAKLMWFDFSKRVIKHVLGKIFFFNNKTTHISFDKIGGGI